MDVTFNINLNQIVDLNEKEQSLLLSLVWFYDFLEYIVRFVGLWSMEIKL